MRGKSCVEILDGGVFIGDVFLEESGPRRCAVFELCNVSGADQPDHSEIECIVGL